MLATIIVRILSFPTDLFPLSNRNISTVVAVWAVFRIRASEVCGTQYASSSPPSVFALCLLTWRPHNLLCQRVNNQCHPLSYIIHVSGCLYTLTAIILLEARFYNLKKKKTRTNTKTKQNKAKSKNQRL